MATRISDEDFISLKKGDIVNPAWYNDTGTYIVFYEYYFRTPTNDWFSSITFNVVRNTSGSIAYNNRNNISEIVVRKEELCKECLVLPTCNNIINLIECFKEWRKKNEH